MILIYDNNRVASVLYFNNNKTNNRERNVSKLITKGNKNRI